MERTLEVHKEALRRLRRDKIFPQLNDMMKRALGGGRQKHGWTISIIDEDDIDIPLTAKGKGMTYVCKFKIANENTKRTEISLNADFDNIIKFISTSGAKSGWEVAFIDGKKKDEKDYRVSNASVSYVEISVPRNWEDYFDHIYDREPQIEIIMSALIASIESNFQNRFHCALVGPPAGGKTETLRAVKEIVGEEAVLEYDATATTQAGAIKDLNDREQLPRILIVEEIEKADPDSLRWLLSVLDHRAEIRKVTARSQVQKETRMLGLATVNDYPLFLKVMYGALQSRFPHKLYYPKPSEELLRRILNREVDKIKGKRSWVNPTITYASQNNIHDPRQLTAICLCGKDDLLTTKKYQSKLDSCDPQKYLQEINESKKKEAADKRALLKALLEE